MRVHFINTFFTIKAWFLCTIIDVYRETQNSRNRKTIENW